MNAPRVYKFGAPEGFEWLLPVDDSDFDVLAFEGESVAAAWKPIRMERLKEEDDGTPLVPSDFPSCSGSDMLILSGLAKATLGSRLEQYGELLPLQCEDGDFWILNVTCIVDALDVDNSTFLRASDTGQILYAKTHVFQPAPLRDAFIFKLPQVLRGPIYVTKPFVDWVDSFNFRGIEFVELWPNPAKDWLGRPIR